MYKASQQALFQETNLQLVSIRNSEINYYVSIMATLGTQAALIGGFTYGLFTLTEPSEEIWANTSLTVFHIGSGICIAASVHVIIVTLLLQILGPGLALNGPVGSMAKAADAMRAELNQVIVSFFIMIFGFTLSTVASFWTVMDMTAAIICSVVFVIALRAWTYYSRRIYLRLYWDRTIINFNEERDSEINPISNLAATFPNAMTGPTLKPQTNGFSASTDRNTSDKNSIGGNDVLMEGYAAMKPVKDVKDTKSGSFDRRYIVLNSRGKINSYKSREHYRNDNKATLNERPLDLQDFNITKVPSSSKIQDLSELLLVQKDEGPDGRKFLFRFDTEEELKSWTDAFNTLHPLQN